MQVTKLGEHIGAEVTGIDLRLPLDEVTCKRLNAAVVEHINRFQPHILIVGMGMGRQEHWISGNRKILRTNCIGTCGACMEYFAGAVPTAPRWLGPLGLEWLYRLLSDPKRFWMRYLIEPWIVAWFLLTRSNRRRKAAATEVERPSS